MRTGAIREGSLRTSVASERRLTTGQEDRLFCEGG